MIDSFPKSQEVIMMKKPTGAELPYKMSTKDAMVVLHVKRELAVIAQDTATVNVENVEPELTDTLSPGLLFEVSPAEANLIGNPTYKVVTGP